MEGGYIVRPYKPEETLDPSLTVGNFHPVTRPLTSAEVEFQSARCEACDAPGCNDRCPVGQNIPEFNKALERGDRKGAFDVALASPLFGLFPVICPQSLCEKGCTFGTSSTFGIPPDQIPEGILTDTITIRSNEREIWNYGLSQGWLKYPNPTEKMIAKYSHQRITVIGAGPAGIYLALALRRTGRPVRIIDAGDEIGGMLWRGIPDFKLPKTDLPIVREAMAASGIQFELGQRVDGDRMKELLATNAVVVLATGTYNLHKVTHPDTNRPITGQEDITSGMEFLFAYNDYIRKGTPIAEPYQVKGKRVIGIGPNDTGMDIARTALRGQAREVRVLQRSKPRGAYKERAHAQLEASYLTSLGASTMDYRTMLPLEVERRGDELCLWVRRGDGEVEGLVTDRIYNGTGFGREQHAKNFGLDGLIVNDDGSTNHGQIYVPGDADNLGATLAVEAAQRARNVAYLIRRKFDRVPAV